MTSRQISNAVGERGIEEDRHRNWKHPSKRIGQSKSLTVFSLHTRASFEGLLVHSICSPTVIPSEVVLTLC